MTTIAILTGFSSESDTIQVRTGVLLLQGNAGRDKLLSSDQSLSAVDAVISWGTCGGLKPGILVGSIAVSSGIVLDDGSSITAHPYATTVHTSLQQSGALTVVTGNVYSGAVEQTDSVAEKASVYAKTSAATSDEGSYAVAKWANTHGKPWAVVGGVSDDWQQTVVWPPGSMRADGSLDVQAALAYLQAHPDELETILREGSTAAYALRALTVAANVLAAAAWGVV